MEANRSSPLSPKRWLARPTHGAQPVEELRSSGSFRILSGSRRGSDHSEVTADKLSRGGRSPRSLSSLFSAVAKTALTPLREHTARTSGRLQGTRCGLGVAALAAVCVLVLVVVYCMTDDDIATTPLAPQGTQMPEAIWKAIEVSERESRAVLVQHATAEQRMRRRVAGTVPQVELASWTLRVVPAKCRDCLDLDTHRAAVEGAATDMRGAPGDGDEAARLRDASHGPYAVFANDRAPLGRVGPMLLAMRSVTDDVDVAAELPHWGWLRHTRTMTPDAASAASPYIAVAGTPSTNSERAARLRVAQRDTWLRYSAVARRDNGFRGRLLHLAVFAAAERSVRAAAAAAAAAADPLGAAGPSAVDANGTDVLGSALQPTLGEFGAASAHAAAREAAGRTGGAVPAGVAFAQRRVMLRADWRASQPLRSPCAGVAEVTVRGGGATPSLAAVAAYVGIPVVPAMTAPAQHVCGASASLWQEALQFSNAVWIDMLADRAPTSKKKAGEEGGWGLGTEVGMTQKSVMWLQYAYHAFPHVPFLIKCDDDSYVKVPQLVSDFVHALHEWKARPALGGVDADGVAAVPADIGALAQRFAARECTYGGLLWGYNYGLPLFAGMHYTLSHQSARVVLERPQAAYGTAGLTDVVELSLRDFDPALEKEYRAMIMTQEDNLIAKALKDRRRRIAQLCPKGHVTFVQEGFPRFHDLRRAVLGVLTWASTVVHRCQPGDMRYVHFFVTNELAVGGDGFGPKAERRAAAFSEEWKRLNANESLGAGWDDLQPVQWVTHGDPTRSAKRSVIETEDGAAVYDITYEGWAYDHLVPGGLRSTPFTKKKRRRRSKFVVVE